MNLRKLGFVDHGFSTFTLMWLYFCRKLKLDYVDLYLIHFPARLKKGDSRLLNSEEVLPLDLRGTWTALEGCVEQGLTKAIGVCNFSSKKIADLLSIAKIPPAVNQVNQAG